MILAIEEVHIICRHRLEAEFLGELEQNRIHPPLGFQPVVVNLHIGVGRAINLHQLGQCLARLGLITRMQPLIHRTRNATGKADHPFGKFPQRSAIDPRLAMVEPLKMPLRNQLRQIFPSLVVLRQQSQMRRPLATHQLLLFLHRKWREINFTSKNRLHPRLLALLVKLHRPKQIPMVGHRHRRHPHRCRTLRQIPHADHPIQQRKLTVDMQVDKRIRHRTATKLSTTPTSASGVCYAALIFNSHPSPRGDRAASIGSQAPKPVLPPDRQKQAPPRARSIPPV